MAQFDDRIAALNVQLAKNTSTENSALVLIQGFSKQLASAIAAAAAAGGTPAQLQALTDLQVAWDKNDSALAAAVAANTPPAPPAV